MEAQRETVETVAEGNEGEQSSQAAGEDGARQIRRRGLLAAAIALGAGAVAKLSAPGRAEAVDGGNMIIGQLNSATNTTILTSNNSAFGLYVYGNPTQPDYAIYGATYGAGKTGVYGQSTSGGIGVQGFSNVNGIGVQGRHDYTPGLGVRGVNTSNGTGLKGVSNTAGSGSADGDGSGTGVHGKSNSGNGVLGQSNFGWGVAGSSGNNVGVYGTAGSGSGVYGTSTSYVGVYGNSTGSATGVFGAGTNYVGGYFQSTNNIGLQGVSMTANVPALYAISTVAPGASRRAAQFDGNIIVNGVSTVTGTKSAAVPHPDGTLRKLYSLESPESYFEDFGEAGLEKGAAAVGVDPDFAVLVQTGKYQVFLTPNGDCRGLYLNAMSPQGFEVRELQGGPSSLPFSYRVVAKRRDVVAPRLEKLERDRVRAFGLKQHSAPPPLTLPPDQVFPEPKVRPQDPSARPGVPPVQPQVPPGRR